MFVLLAAIASDVGFAGAGSTRGDDSSRVVQSLDSGLCPFPLEITVRTTKRNIQAGATALQFEWIGPGTVTLRNTVTGRTKVLDASGSFAVDTRTGSIALRGHQIWYWSTGKDVPFLSTDGRVGLKAPYFVLSGAAAQARVIDPCALVSPAAPSTLPVTTSAPWGLPTYALSQFAYSGLTPVIGSLVRHDHVHVDVIVNGKKVTIPAGVGLAEPADTGPCPPSPDRVGDCTPGHVFVPKVALVPLHTHSTSGIIHIESDRPGRFTLGEFFDVWGVRLTSSCIGGYCAGHGKQLRIYVNGKRAPNPRTIVLTNHQEIAIVFGGAGSFGSVPSTYNGGWPGLGCGGPGEHSCLP
jgi:hypothetical protein